MKILNESGQISQAAWDKIESRESARAPQLEGAEAKHVSSKEDAWIILYEDADVTPEFFFGEGAKECALRKYKIITDSWNASLFRRVQINWYETELSLQPAPTRPAAVDDSVHIGSRELEDTIYNWSHENGRCLSVEEVQHLISWIRPYLQTPPDKAATIEKMASALWVKDAVGKLSPRTHQSFYDESEETKTRWINMAQAAYEAEHD